jgi:Na+/proline symporter
VIADLYGSPIIPVGIAVFVILGSASVVTVTEAVSAGFEMEVAVSVELPAADAAVNFTEVFAVFDSEPPPLTFHVTPWKDGSFADVTVNVSEEPASRCAAAGEIVSVIGALALVSPQPLANITTRVATASKAKIFFMTSSEILVVRGSCFIMEKESASSTLIVLIN